MTIVLIYFKLYQPVKTKLDKKLLIPVARREFTTVECYTNVSRYAENGHDEAVRLQPRGLSKSS